MKVLYTLMVPEPDLRLVEERNRRRKESPAESPEGISSQSSGTVVCAWACSGRARHRQATKTARQVARNADADGTDAARLAARRVDALREGGSAAERLAAGATDGS